MQFRVWYGNGDFEHKTMPRIAKALGMVPSQHVSDMLNEMAEAGVLTVEERDQKGRWTTKFYLLHEKASYHGEKHVRQIPLKSRGVAVGQLEMFS